MKLRLALVALPFALAGCTTMTMPWDKPAPAPAPVVAAAPAPAKPSIPDPTGASPLEQPLEVAGVAAIPVATVDAATRGVSDYTAAGEGWSATATGGKVVFARAGGKSATVSVKRLAYAKGVEYVGTLNDKPFTLNIRGTACGDKPMTATVRANGTTYSGCAMPGAAAPAAKPAAKSPSA